jgi:transcriptional regulator with XRE-family HTH domain
VVILEMNELKQVATIPDRLREALADAGKKQIELAEETGLSHSTISRYLSGRVEPKQSAAHKIAKTLGVSEMWLWGYDVPKVRTEEQKKNDDLVKVIAQLRSDPEFFNIVSMLAGLPADQYANIKALISALGQK